jgi:hypothetical protein
MILLDAKVHSEHVKVIRSDIGTKLVQKCRDVENEPISRKELGVLLQACFLKHRYIFWRLKTSFLRHTL